MNVFIRAMVRIFYNGKNMWCFHKQKMVKDGERWNVSVKDGTFHLSPHENILTIALINIFLVFQIPTCVDITVYQHRKCFIFVNLGILYM